MLPGRDVNIRVTQPLIRKDHFIPMEASFNSVGNPPMIFFLPSEVSVAEISIWPETTITPPLGPFDHQMGLGRT
jgi:hypothetical protein